MNNLRQQHGFTITELIVAITLVGIGLALMGPMLVRNFYDYLEMQHNGMAYGNVATQTQRVARVMRGAVEIVNAQHNEVTLVAYFAPSDDIVSKVRYYVDGGALKADVTPYTANPPAGTPIPSQLRTTTIVSSYFNPSGNPIFRYYDANGNAYPTPDVELTMVKGVSIELSARGAKDKVVTSTVRVTIRNAKTNL